MPLGSLVREFLTVSNVSDKFHSTSFLSTFLPPNAYIGPSEASTEEKVSLPAPVVAPSIVEENAWVKPPLAAMLNLFDLEYVASRVMSAEGWGYYSSGADDEITLRENHAGENSLLPVFNSDLSLPAHFLQAKNFGRRQEYMHEEQDFGI
jgi:hypothetical protein